MKTEIEFISEAYSMQPRIMWVGEVYNYGGGLEKNVIIDRIVPEDVYITGDPFQYYVGYDKDNNRLFEYRKGSVNVHYKVN